MKKVMKISGLIILACLLYLFFWPVPIDPQLWYPPEAPDMSGGPFQRNDQLRAAKLFSLEGYGSGPEDITIDSSGNIYSGLKNGKILRFDPDGSNPEVIAETGGRPLGMQFDTYGSLIIADASKGLLSMNPDGNITLLTHEHNGEKLGLVNDLDIGSDGVIYFSDASRKFGIGQYYLDLVEHGLNARVYAFDPSTGKTILLMDSLSYANGITLSPDESYLLICETGAYRIHKFWLKGQRKGQSEIFIENLPGFPDNISCNGQDTYWVAIANPRNAALDKILPIPFLRKIILRLPEFLRPSEVRYGMVLGFGLQGNLIYNLQDTDGIFAPVTSVNEWKGNLYLGSLSADSWALFPIP